ncbi:oxidoreductase [Streptantibioticus parmotrematis]|uniref:oxidoreductase n=1 Tax=Streptantibioticus parmotrematis TaxID=2873249 RepID=UPI003401421A
MDLQLSGRTAVVTGGSRGIGLAIVRALVREGVRVVAAARTITPELKESGALPVAVDLTSADGCERLVDDALAALGGLDVLVNNAGGGDSYAADGFLAADDEVWRRTWELNFFAPVRLVRAALPALMERRGTVINISSVGAHVPGRGPVDYSTAKAALGALGKALSEEFGPHGVRVNTVSPGPTRTALYEDPDGYAARKARQRGIPHADYLARVPQGMGMTSGRLVEPEEVADLVAFLASGRAASVMGADYVIDGGAVKAL